MITYINYRIGDVTGNISNYNNDDEVVLPKKDDSITLNQADVTGTFTIQSVNGPFTLSNRRTYTLDLRRVVGNPIMRQMPLEKRIKYQVTKDFTAHRFSADAYMAEDESYGTDDVAISVGDILDADINVWHGK